MKRILSVLLTILFLLAALPLGAVSVSATTSGTTGDCTWALDDNGHLTISGNGAMESYYKSETPWGTSIVAVTIEDGVTTIGDWAFLDCVALTSVTIPDSVITIGEYAFADCFSLKSVTIGDSVTAIGWYAFERCEFLTTVTIPDSVITIGLGAFSDCTSLTAVTIGDSVTIIEYGAFDSCSRLESFIVSTDNTNFCSMDGVLLNKDATILLQCPAGKCGAYTVPDSVITIGEEAFHWCKSLASVIISDSVTTIGRSAFYNCDSLISVTIGDKVTTIESYAFANCESLESVTIPDSVTTIGGGAFTNCYALTSVTIPNSVTSIEWETFRNCNSLTSVTIPNSITVIGVSAFENCDSLTMITVGDSVAFIGDGAFYDCDFLTSVHYHGSEQDRDAIHIRSDNDILLSAIWHYYDNAYDPDCNVCGETREVPEVMAGDANDDGKVNVKDLGLLQQKLNGWDVTIIDDACDVNGDGKVNVKDLGLLQQYLNGWDVELILPGTATVEMVWPVPICQRIGQGYHSEHRGIDICNGPVPILGKPCIAAESGTVVYAGWYYKYGYVVKIQHTDELATMYAHLESFTVVTGQQVARGETIGLVGNSGDAVAPHLHFEVIKDGERVNPLDHVTPSE